MSDMTYPAIESLAAVGDGRSLALIGSDGGVEWYCPGRFDADPLVWPLLDRERGGELRVAPRSPISALSHYVENTAVLHQEWTTATGTAKARVAMPFPGDGAQALMWTVEAVSGEVDLDVVFDPRPGFGRIRPCLALDGAGAGLVAGELRVRFDSSVPLEPRRNGVGATYTLLAGAQAAFRLATTGDSEMSEPPALIEAVFGDVTRAVDGWRRWVAALDYDGRWAEHVVRAAITLRLLIYEPSGAVVAAGTTSLPEVIGGARNWDYRYTWLRDASFALNALYQLGCTREARNYSRWLCRAVAKHGTPLRVLYGVGGETDFDEYEITANGYRNSRPVRVGNAAEHQLQLDSYGELLDCLAICEVLGDDVMRDEWPHFRKVVDFVADHWREPDSGIWEVRDEPRHFVHSKVMAWTALDRGTRIVRQLGLPGDAERWEVEAELLRAEVLARGVTSDGRFRRAYGDRHLDASLLTLPLVGFVDGRDPIMTATLEAIRAELPPSGACVPGLLRRYHTGAGDGLAGEEGAFAICSFWLVEALALAGRGDEAEHTFEAMIGLAGDHGLFAEEFGPTGGHLGNTPQAFTHIGLINAALRLQQRSGKGRQPAAGTPPTRSGHAHR